MIDKKNSSLPKGFAESDLFEVGCLHCGGKYDIDITLATITTLSDGTILWWHHRGQCPTNRRK